MSMDRKEFETDSYGQVIAPVKWSNVFSWPLTLKYTAYGAALGVVSFLMFNRYNRRPYYAGIWFALPPTIGSGAFGYCAGRYKEYVMRNRDAVISHYMSLHPDDFKHLSANSRQWKDVLLPWQPIRYYESPYKWTPDAKKKVESSE